MLILNTIYPHIISLPELSYTVKQNVIYRLVNVIYIHYNRMFWENSISYLNTITPYSENIASYCDSILIKFNTIYNDVDVLFLHYS